MATTSTQERRVLGRPHRRTDAGRIRLGQRDNDGLLLCAEHGGAPYTGNAAQKRPQPHAPEATSWSSSGRVRMV